MAFRFFTRSLRTSLSFSSSSLSRSLLPSSSLSSFSRSIPPVFPSSDRFLSTLAPGQNYKQSTNITGLDVVENPREVLSALYGEIIKRLSSYPSTSLANDYNIEVKKLIQWRLKKVEEITDIRRLEQVIGGLIVEELIVEAEEELDLIIRMNESDWLSSVFAETDKEIEIDPDWGEKEPAFVNREQDIVFRSIDELQEYQAQQEKEFFEEIDKEIEKENADAAAAAAAAATAATATKK